MSTGDAGHGTARHGTARHGTALYGPLWCRGASQRILGHYSTARLRKLQARLDVLFDRLNFGDNLWGRACTRLGAKAAHKHHTAANGRVTQAAITRAYEAHHPEAAHTGIMPNGQCHRARIFTLYSTAALVGNAISTNVVPPPSAAHYLLA